MYISAFSKCVQGFIAGFIIAVICFRLLPQAFEENGVFYGVIGLTLGTVLAIALENLKYFKSKKSDICNTLIGCLFYFLSFVVQGGLSPFLLAFAVGEIIYVCCGRILPEDGWKVALVSSIAGFAISILLV